MTTKEALALVNEELGIGAAVTIKGDEVKCYTPDDEGGVSKTYLGASDCRNLSLAFARLAEALDSGVDLGGEVLR